MRRGHCQGCPAWTILLSNKHILQTVYTKNLRAVLFKGQAVASIVKHFVQDWVSTSCGISKQVEIHFAGSENDDVMK